MDNRKTDSRKTDRILEVLMSLALLLLAVVLWDAMRNKVVGVGDIAPEFSVTTSAGKTVTRDNFGGKYLMVNFWASWCAPCVQETPLLQALHDEGKDRGLTLLAISVDKSQKNYENFRRRHNVTFLTAHDPEQKINDMFGSYRYPETYLVDKSGKVVLKKVGVLDQETVKMIREML